MIMQTAPELIFHDVDRSAWVESYILERVQRLERFADGITSCRVTLTQEQASHHKGNRYSVMVETRMPPNHDLAAKKGKVIHDMPQQLPALINLAFGAVERQLKKTAQLRRGETKSRDNGAVHGIVEKLFGEGYGFLREVGDDRQVYFHRNSVLHDDFERLAVGTEVRFTPQDGDEGPQASSVQIVAKPGASP
ncbi:MAG TPA: HPF/RaiA family ribosome-associated protein [Burkholderiales bacterium]|nr:HPF/RaiA family ribosome-associated protein [Burkholderiales bacterium]